MATGRGKEQKREQELQTQADVATQAWQPSELEKLQEKNTISFLNDWTGGKDVKDIAGLSPYYNLYEGAKNQQSAEKLGGGLFNASASNTGGLATAITAQNQARKEQEASGQLMNAANSAYQYSSGVLAPSLMQMSDNRLSGRASLANNRYNVYLGRPKTPNPWLSVLQSGLGAAGTALGGYLGG